MNQITLALPFALLPPELAPDLLRALKAPALAKLISRTASQRTVPFESGLRCLPHESWLARELGGRSEAPAFAAVAMQAFGLDPADGTWFIIHPVHVALARNHLLMNDMRKLDLSEAEARVLFDAAKPYFDELGNTLLYGDAQTWFMRADGWTGLDTASPDAAAGTNLNVWMPEGANALAFRKLQNEVQMLWHSHHVNEQRQARGRGAVNAFWMWAAADATSLRRPHDLSVATDGSPSWLAAMGKQPRDAASLLQEPAGDTLVILGGLAGPAMAADWSAWLDEMHRLERLWFAPLLGALAASRVTRLRLVASHRDAHAEYTTTKLAQRKFWRRPTLNRLLP